VQKKNGETIHGLRPEQFIVEDNGIRQPVHVDAAPESSSLSIVVLVQCSRSSPEEFANMKGLGTMIEGIVGNSRYEVAIVGYGDRPYMLGDFSSRPEAARLALSRLSSCGDFNAATVDAINYATGMLRTRPADYRRAILLVSEMRDHGSSARLDDAVAKLGITDTVIYSVAFSPVVQAATRGFRAKPRGSPAPSKNTAAPMPAYNDPVPTLELPPQLLPLVNALRQNTASELAALSGGDYATFTTKRAFDEDLQRISNQIRNYYLLSFAPGTKAAPGLHAIRIRIAGNSSAVVQTRRSYYWSETSAR